MKKQIREYAIQCIKDEVDAVMGLIPQLDDDFERAVELIYNCRGKVIVTGVGKSGHIGAKIAATFSSTGTPSFFINPLDVYHGDLGVMTHDDVVLAISNSGQTDELLRFIPMVLHMNIPIIGMSTSFTRSCWMAWRFMRIPRNSTKAIFGLPPSLSLRNSTWKPCVER